MRSACVSVAVLLLAGGSGCRVGFDPVDQAPPGTALDNTPDVQYIDGCCGGSLVDPVTTLGAATTRWFLSEAVSGQGPTAALDATGLQDLGVVYDANMAFATTDGHRGLQWTAADTDGVAAASLEPGLAADLDGAKQLTIELVVEVVATGSSAFLFRIGEKDPQLALGYSTAGGLALAYNGVNDRAIWSNSLASRSVIHVVVDTEQVIEDDRTRLYIDGDLQPLFINSVGFGLQLLLPGAETVSLGNHPAGGLSPQGTLYYAAIYDRALTAQEAAEHAYVLTYDDD